MFNTVGVLERSFTPTEGGFLYYPSRWSHGYLVTTTEYEALINDWRRVAGWKGILIGVGILLLAATLGVVAIDLLGGGESVKRALTYCLAAVLVIYVIWKSTAASRLVRGRDPAAPPRSSKEAEFEMGRTLGRPLAIWMAFASLCFLGWAMLFALSDPLWGVPLALFVAVVAFFNLRIAFRAFRSKL